MYWPEFGPGGGAFEPGKAVGSRSDTNCSAQHDLLQCLGRAEHRHELTIYESWVNPNLLSCIQNCEREGRGHVKAKVVRCSALCRGQWERCAAAPYR